MSIDLKTVNIKPLRLTYAHVAKYIGENKIPTRYQEATFGAQPNTNFHYRPTWDPDHELFDTARTAIKMKDWYAIKDPRQFYYGSWTGTRAKQQETVEANFSFVESRGLIALLPEAVKQRALDVLTPLRHVAWGANMNNSQICAIGYGTSFTAPAMFHAMDNLAVAQYLTRLALVLEGPERLDQGKLAWLHDANWQLLRRYVEDTFVVQDPVELFVAQNLVLDGLLYPLVFDTYVDNALAMQGGSAISMLTAFITEWHSESKRWVDAVVKTIAAESEENKALLTQWFRHWEERAADALTPVSVLAMGDAAASALDDVRQGLANRVKKLGLTL
ncbi:aromatic/alkene monooxygenase hydroxylase subunit beta [Hydrogenophilus thermoluteolus]|nr:aromatic/alkene monooxygenase hydroxylase subunit beta [Hydrogenophilus thermoluteolus]MBW7656832.1 aromatic/alkene monooxygenase hydroxylase subunit beta [Hydrogenophilus thermoluteolus]